MARKKRKAVEPQNTAPPSIGYADSAADFTCANAVEAGQVTTAKVYMRRDRLDDLLSRHVISGEGWRVLNAYRTAWERGGFDRSRSCLDNSVGAGDGIGLAIITARRTFTEMHQRIPAICRETVADIVLHGRSLVARADSCGRSLTAVKDELRRAVIALMVRVERPLDGRNESCSLSPS
jgi:hypothetical protein